MATARTDKVKPGALRKFAYRLKRRILDYYIARTSVQNAFRLIYQQRLWGSDLYNQNTPFCSGCGSNLADHLDYIEYVAAYIDSHGYNHIVDLGCGDFTIGQQLIKPGMRYSGVDVVPELIQHNDQTHGGENISFSCANLLQDPLPEGDVYLLRQVLQHLANAEIKQVLENLPKGKSILVTEHYIQSKNLKSPNLDITHGAGVRAAIGSAVYLSEPPFSLKQCDLLFCYPVKTPLYHDGETLNTYEVIL